MAPDAALQEPKYTAKSLYAALRAGLGDDTARALADQMRAMIGAEELARGADPLIEDSTVVWAIEAPGASTPPEIVADNGNPFRQTLSRLGDTDVYAAAVTLPEGAAMQCSFYVDGNARAHRPHEGIVEVYHVHPDSRRQPGVPAGALIQQPSWQSRIFEGTVRDWWLYVPAQYAEQTPACVMIFQDGGVHYKDCVPVVFDNLIARGEMPVTLGIFLDPGTYAATTVSNRSFEYDTLSDQYARFLLDEILPAVEQSYRLRQDRLSRAIAGISSGGICAFTTAWQRPDQFSKVLSWVGSFTNIAAGPTLREGGHNYPALIRRMTPKPLRVFLQGGENDLDNQWGCWPLANQELARALAYAGYDYRFVYGQGYHTRLHGRAILPDSLRWLWRPSTYETPLSRPVNAPTPG